LSLRSNIRTIIFNCIWLLIFVVSLPWLAWRFFSKGKNRRGWKQKLLGLCPVAEHSSSNRIWLHAVSVGEVHLLETLIDHLRQKRGDAELFISTTTETGYDRAVSLFGEECRVFFFPFDFSWAIRNVIKRIKPDLLVLAELELWPNLIHLAAESKVPVVVANGRLSENSHRNYRRIGILTRPMFSKLHHVGVQDQVYAQRFVDLGCAEEKVTVTGNLKYDSIETNRDNQKTKMCRFVAADCGIYCEDPTLVAGSTQIEDEAAIVEAWLNVRSSFPKLKLIVVPRHPDRIGEIESLLAEHSLEANRRSQHGSKAIESDILIVDVIGELSGWWGLADIAFVGGSMGSRGGQNMIEPAAYGLPVCFGPNTANFKTTVDGLLSEAAAVVVRDSNELAEFVSAMLADHEASIAIGKRAQDFVLKHRGAADRTVKILDEVLRNVDDWRLDRAA
jgi:3-deoxy-D-manno-octulosonic-acid transferase